MATIFYWVLVHLRSWISNSMRPQTERNVSSHGSFQELTPRGTISHRVSCWPTRYHFSCCISQLYGRQSLQAISSTKHISFQKMILINPNPKKRKHPLRPNGWRATSVLPSLKGLAIWDLIAFHPSPNRKIREPKNVRPEERTCSWRRIHSTSRFRQVKLSPHATRSYQRRVTRGRRFPSSCYILRKELMLSTTRYRGLWYYDRNLTPPCFDEQSGRCIASGQYSSGVDQQHHAYFYP